MKVQPLIFASVALTAGCGRPDAATRSTAGRVQASAKMEAGEPSLRKIVGGEITEATLSVGQAEVTESQSSEGRFAAVFEDDGDTGWYYALDHSRTGNPIVDALHIYNVDGVVDRDRPSLLQIVWSTDGLKAALFINSYPHAIYDFEAMRGSCRSGVGSSTTQGSHEWDDAQLEHFYAEE